MHTKQSGMLGWFMPKVSFQYIFRVCAQVKIQRKRSTACGALHNHHQQTGLNQPMSRRERKNNVSSKHWTLKSFDNFQDEILCKNDIVRKEKIFWKNNILRKHYFNMENRFIFIVMREKSEIERGRWNKE